MASDAQEISKVDSAVSGLSSSPKDEKQAPAKRRTTSSAPGVMNINDLGKLTVTTMGVSQGVWHTAIAAQQSRVNGAGLKLTVIQKGTASNCK
jgi:hypothetical protein